MKKILALTLALVMILALAACGQSAAPAAAPAEEPAEAERTSFIMGIDPEYPPFSYLGDDGNYTGFDVEICQAVCDYLHFAELVQQRYLAVLESLEHFT